MKFKIFMMIAMFMILACGVGRAFAGSKYYCPESDGSFLQFRDIYDTAEDCSEFNNSFWKKEAPALYNSCLEYSAIAKKKYKQGKCEPIIVKKHHWGSCKATVELVPKTNTPLSVQVNEDSCYVRLKRLYPDFLYPNPEL